MKKNALLVCLSLALVALVPAKAFAVDTESATNAVTLGIATSTQLAIVTGQAISLSLGGATQAGAPVQEVAANDENGAKKVRLRISCMAGSSKYKISAKIGTSIASTNTQLKVNFLAPNTNFANPSNAGTLVATTAAPVVLTTSDQSLVTDVTTCWSGITEDDGYKIIYTYERIPDQATYTSPGLVTVTYTLAAQP